MTRIRRISALLVSLFLIQLLLVESGFACQMAEMQPSGIGTTASSADDMAGMDMGAMDMAGMNMPNGPQDDGDTPDDAPCRFPWAPSGCQSMSPCGVAALATVAPALTSPQPVPGAIQAVAILAPPSETRAPELPPPRA